MHLQPMLHIDLMQAITKQKQISGNLSAGQYEVGRGQGSVWGAHTHYGGMTTGTALELVNVTVI